MHPAPPPTDVIQLGPDDEDDDDDDDDDDESGNVHELDGAGQEESTPRGQSAHQKKRVFHTPNHYDDSQTTDMFARDEARRF